METNVQNIKKRVVELERSSDELRATLLLAGREIKKLNFGKTDTPPSEAATRTF